MILPYLNLAIVFHCLAFGLFFLVRRRGVGRSDQFLSLLLILLGIMSLPFCLKPTGWIEKFPYLVDMEWPAGFLFAPVYFWYVCEMVGEKVECKRGSLLLFLPAILALLYFGKYYFLNTEEQHAYVGLIRTTYLKEYEIGDALFYPYIQGYFGYIIFFLHQKQKKTSGIWQRNAVWLKWYTLLLLSFGFIGLAVFFLKLPQIYIDALPILSALIYFTLIFKSLHLHAVSSGQPLLSEMEKVPIVEKKELLHADERHEKIAMEIRTMLEQEKKYRDQSIDLSSLAARLDQPVYLVSQTMKLCYGKKLMDLVTEYRIKEAKERLKSITPTETIEGIAQEVGFSSRASFYRAYKKYTGENPTETVQSGSAEKALETEKAS